MMHRAARALWRRLLHRPVACHGRPPVGMELRRGASSASRLREAALESVPIHQRNHPSEFNRHEVFDHVAFISYMAMWYRPTLYVEYGIREGACVEAVMPHCREVWGIDTAIYRSRDPRFKFFHMTTREFAQTLVRSEPKIDMAFIDACHESEAVLQDFDDLFPWIIDDGMVFLHDTHPIAEEYTVPGLCSDCWKTPGVLKERYGDRVEVLTIPIMPGLTMVRKVRRVAAPWL